MPGLNYPGEPVTPPSGDEVFTLTPSPEGMWSSIQHGAVYYNGVTYFGWVNGANGDIKVASYDHATETVSTPFTIDNGGPTDTHNSPSLLIRDSDKRLMVAYCYHNGSTMGLRIATNPEDATAFAAGVDLDPSIGGSDYTYPQLFQLTGVTNDPIYLIYRDQSGSTGRIAYSKSTNDGVTWSARTVFLTAASTNRAYWNTCADTTKIHIMTTDRDAQGLEGPVDLGHMYLDGTDDKWYTSAGVEITATKPFTHSELTQLETNVSGAAVQDGIASANTVFTYFVDNGDDTITAKYARWDGSAWDKGTIYTEDEIEFDPHFGFLAINRADPEEVFSGVSTGAGTSELFTYVSGDLGATWDAGTQITTGSADYNVAALAPRDGDATLPVMWLRGTYIDEDDFPFGIKGLRR